MNNWGREIWLSDDEREGVWMFDMICHMFWDCKEIGGGLSNGQQLATAAALAEILSNLATSNSFFVVPLSDTRNRMVEFIDSMLFSIFWAGENDSKFSPQVGYTSFRVQEDVEHDKSSRWQVFIYHAFKATWTVLKIQISKFLDDMFYRHASTRIM